MTVKLKLVLLIALLALASGGWGCSSNVIDTLRAKNELNLGVHEFNRGGYNEAEKKFERALELSPELPNARLFYARAINARFDQSLTEELGIKTIKAYDTIISKNQDSPAALDQALALQAAVYEKLAGIEPAKAAEYKLKHRDVLLRRAELARAAKQTQAEADVYYIIGSGYWKESYELNYPYAKAKQVTPADVLEKMKPHIAMAHQYLQMAISVKPDYANAWFYESLVYIEEAKVEQDAAKRKQLMAKVDSFRKRYIDMQAPPKEQAGQAAAQTPSK